jgi:hypothetical protein
MKTHINPTTKGYLVRGAFYLLLLLALCVIPFALAQRSTSGNTTQLPTTSSDRGRGTLAIPKLPTGFALWDQYNSPATEPPINVGSQDFEPASDTLDDQAADDFVFTYPYNNCITAVRVMGEYSEGGGPASSFNVYFYANAAGNLPGTLIAAFFNLTYTGTPPEFVINLSNPFCMGPGTYWVSVQARQDLNPNGQWYWHDRTVQSNAGAAWQNPGDGYGTGCVSWNRKNACMPDQAWPDQVFQIIGFTEGNPPTPPPRRTPRPRPTPAPRP